MKNGQHDHIRKLYRDLTTIGEEANKRVTSVSAVGLQGTTGGAAKQVIQATSADAVEASKVTVTPLAHASPPHIHSPPSSREVPATSPISRRPSSTLIYMASNSSPASCQLCGTQRPTKHVEFKANIGAVFVRYKIGIDGYLCRGCIHQQFWKHILTNLFLGWWGSISFFVTPVYIIQNLVVYLPAILSSWKWSASTAASGTRALSWLIPVGFFFVVICLAIYGGFSKITPWATQPPNILHPQSGPNATTARPQSAPQAKTELKGNPSVAAVAVPKQPAIPSRAGPVQAIVGVFSNSRSATPLSPGEERALKPKDSFKECDVCPEMVVVPAGEFTMGSPAGESRRLSNEGPQHKVTFRLQFAVSRFALTFDEWDACVTGGGCSGYKPDDGGWGRGQRPVINVSWLDAKSYVEWLSRKTGKTYRLLSEAEREYVTRAGTTTSFWWGSGLSPSQANYDGNYMYEGIKGVFRKNTLSVDSFSPNPWGLYQLHGNVWEWTEDCWNESYSRAPTDGTAWTSGDCGRRVLRGGSWYSHGEHLRSAVRNGYSAANRNGSNSLRTARTLTNH